MALTRWDPTRDLDDFNTRLARLFGPGALGTNDLEKLTLADWKPAVDIEETPEAFVVHAELPSVKKEDIHVTVQNHVLTLKGERRHEKEDKGNKFHRIERSYGSFLRSFQLPDTADDEHIVASIEDGVLQVKVPKVAVSKGPAKRIDVK